MPSTLENKFKNYRQHLFHLRWCQQVFLFLTSPPLLRAWKRYFLGCRPQNFPDHLTLLGFYGTYNPKSNILKLQLHHSTMQTLRNFLTNSDGSAGTQSLSAKICFEADEADVYQFASLFQLGNIMYSVLPLIDLSSRNLEIPLS